MLKRVIVGILRWFGLRLVKVGPPAWRRAKPSPKFIEEVKRKYSQDYDISVEGAVAESAPVASLDHYRVTPQTARHLFWLSWAAQHMQDLPPDAKILDVGSDVFFVVGLSALSPNIEFLDISDHPCRPGFALKYRVGSVATAELPSDHYDAVTLLQVLHHIGMTYGQQFDPSAAGAALRRVASSLRPDGKLFIVTWVKDGRPSLRLGSDRAFNENELDAMIDESGLTIVEKERRSMDSFRKLLGDSRQVPKLANAFSSDCILIVARRATDG